MDHTLQAGDRISHYRIVGALGSGGMGEVYLAQDLTLERSVALKVLPPRLVRNEERLRRFVIEAKAASSLNHPSIVTIYEIGSGTIEREGDASAPTHFIAMERIDGHTLAELIHLDKEDLRRLLGYLAQAADGIAKAHAAGIVHRDLKPSNIMVSRDGFAKVLDFGLAKLTEGKAADEDASIAPTRTGEQTGAGVVMGTVGYMSPEQVQGKPVDHRSDIFSFGCILYEAVTRKRAFEADSAVDTMHKILHDAPVESHELNPNAPADLRRLVRRCLAKSPDQRLQSMKDLAIELREIADNYESLSSSTSSTSSGSGIGAIEAVPRPAGRRRWLIGGAIVAIVGIAGLAVGITSLMGHRTTRPADAAPAAGLKITSISGRAGVAGVRISGDGRYLAYSTNLSGTWSLWVRQVSTGSEVQVVLPRKKVLEAERFSSNGDYVLYSAEDLERPGFVALEQVSTLGGPSRKLLSVLASDANVALDGRRVCIIRENLKSAESSALVRDIETGQEKTLATIASPLSFQGPFALSPDGKTFVASVHTAEKGIHAQFLAVDTASLAQTRFGPAGWEVVGGQWLPDGTALIVSAFRYGETEGLQLFLVSYPDGRYRRITNDSNEYPTFDVTADGMTIAALRSVRVANVWSVPVERKTRPTQITYNATSDNAVSNFVPLSDGAIAFSAATDHYSHVWTIGAAGQNPRQLTAGTSYEYVQRSLPSGELVVAQSGEDRTAHIIVTDRDGGNPRPLVRGTGEWFQGLSPDGKTLLYMRVDALRELWSVPVAGGEPRRVATDYNYNLDVSPDSRMIAYFTPPELEGESPTTCIVAPIEGGTPIATFAWPPRAGAPKWMPDGKGLSFLVWKEGVSNLFIQPLSGGSPRPVTRLTEGTIDDYLWSPDGKRLVLKRTIANVANLWSAGTDGRAPQPITDFATGSIFAIDAAKDGKTIYFLYGNESSDIVLLKGFR
jgi:serine/threonine protein kinase/Tol biopolymer transport system component